MINLKIKRNQLQILGDYWLSFTALIQSVLMLLQSLMIDSGFLAEETASVLRILLSILMVGVAFFWILNRSLKVTLIIYGIYIFLFAFSILLSENNYEFIIQEGLRFTLAICIPIFLSLISVKNTQILLRVCLIISYIGAFVGALYSIFYLTGNLPMLNNLYNMSFGYSLLLPVMLLIYFNKNKFLILFLIVSILIEGSRGPLVPIFILLFYKMWISCSKLKLLLLLLAGIVCLLIFLPILIDYLSIIGINSRTLLLLVDGSIDSDSGRGDIYSFVWSKIVERPLLGYGLFADRTFLGVYCHNIFLEMFLNWGLVIPLILCILLFSILIFLYKKVLFKDEKFFLILLFSSSIIPLFVSSSYLIDFRLPILCGFLYIYIKKYHIFKIPVH